jgi:hypothetical protein
MRDCNKLGWKFIGPCGFDASNKLCTFAECICLEESLDRYEWIVNAMLDMVPAVEKAHIKVIFGDGIMSEQLLIQLGIKETCRIFWDPYHLNKAWKEYFSDRVFTELEPNLSALLNAPSREEFDNAAVKIKYTLRSSAAHLDHMKKFLSQPHLFAAYEIDSVPGLLGKRGSSISESQHGSIVAHVGKGASMDPEEHVLALLRRQDILNTQKQLDDFKYKNAAFVQSEDEKENDRTVRCEAMVKLEKWGYSLWSQEVKQSSFYCKKQHPCIEGAHVVSRNAKDPDSGRVILLGGGCTCLFGLKFCLQCRHEYLFDGCFEEKRCSFRFLVSGDAVAKKLFADSADLGHEFVDAVTLFSDGECDDESTPMDTADDEEQAVGLGARLKPATGSRDW